MHSARATLLRLTAVVALANGPPAFAAVTFTGTVDPAAPSSVGVDQQVTVGGPFSGGQEPGDPRGSVRVDDGSFFEAGSLLVGAVEQSLASVFVEGAGSRLRLNDSGGQPTLGVGHAGSGHLSVRDGAWVEVGPIGQTGVGTMTIGTRDGFNPGHATAEVRGESSLLTVGGGLFVGGGIDPRLSIADAAVVQVVGFDGVSVFGTVEVSGSRSELQTDRIAIGGGFSGNLNSQVGELQVSDGAVVRPVSRASRSEIGFGGRLVLDGGTFALPLQQMRGVVTGSGTLTEDIRSSGTVLVGPGDTLDFLSSLRSSGEIAVSGGALTVSGPLVNEDFGEGFGSMVLSQSVIDLRGGLSNAGSVEATDSVIQIGQAISESNRIAASGASFRAIRSRVEFSGGHAVEGELELVDSEVILVGVGGSTISVGDGGIEPGRVVLDNATISQSGCCSGFVSNAGVIEARAGESRVTAVLQGNGGALEIGRDASITFGFAEFFGGATLEAGGSALFQADSRIGDLAITITDANRERASLVAASSSLDLGLAEFVFDGDLTVEAEDLMSVEAGQVFRLIEADELDVSVTNYELPDLPGTLEFLPEITETELSLRVIDASQTLPGDFSGDGLVDAADYTLWRDGIPGGSDWFDHTVWRTNYGRTLAAPGGASVPEPAGALLAVAGLLAGLGFRRAA